MYLPILKLTSQIEAGDVIVGSVVPDGKPEPEPEGDHFVESVAVERVDTPSEMTNFAIRCRSGLLLISGRSKRNDHDFLYVVEAT